MSAALPPTGAAQHVVIRLGGSADVKPEVSRLLRVLATPFVALCLGLFAGVGGIVICRLLGVELSESQQRIAVIGFGVWFLSMGLVAFGIQLVALRRYRRGQKTNADA